MTGNRRLLRLAMGHLTFGVVAGLLAPIELNKTTPASPHEPRPRG